MASAVVPRVEDNRRVAIVGATRGLVDVMAVIRVCAANLRAASTTGSPAGQDDLDDIDAAAARGLDLLQILERAVAEGKSK